MLIDWEELEELGIDWEDFCDTIGYDYYACSEGWSGEDIELSIKQFKKLLKKSGYRYEL